MFTFSHLPSPEYLLQTGAMLPLPSQQGLLQERYSQLLTPDQLVPDLFTRIAQGLKKPLPKPQATGIQPSGLRATSGETAKPSAAQPPKPSQGDAPPQEDKKPAAEEQKPEPSKPEPQPKSSGPSAGKKPPEFLTREKLMTWQHQLQSGAPMTRRQAAADINQFLSQHDSGELSAIERRAMAALVLNMLQDTDEVVRHMAITELSLGRIQFTRQERRQSPYRELNQRVNRLLAIKDPVYALDADERPLVETLKRNWTALTTLDNAGESAPL